MRFPALVRPRGAVPIPVPADAPLAGRYAAKPVGVPTGILQMEYERESLTA